MKNSKKQNCKIVLNTSKKLCITTFLLLTNVINTSTLYMKTNRFISSPTHQNTRKHLVVLHLGADIIVHRKPGRVPHRESNGGLHRFSRGLGSADQSQVRNPEGWIHGQLFPGTNNVRRCKFLKMFRFSVSSYFLYLKCTCLSRMWSAL